MTKHYALQNKIARANLNWALTKIKSLKKKKYEEKLGIIDEASLKASQTP